MKAKAVAITQSLVTDESGNALTPDQHIVYTARVSNPSNQQNHATGPKLLEFCMIHGHWSVFEQADLTIEVETSRAIAAQLLRHKSFSFQEFSQRYSDVAKLGDVMVEELEMRAKHVQGNRQGSGEDIGHKYLEGTSWNINAIAEEVVRTALKNYHLLISNGVAPECARMILPLATRTRLYVKGSVRSWIHYLETRTTSHTQKEHRELAYEIEEVFAAHFPTVHEAMNLRRIKQSEK